ncbi:MAG: hypothetical protein K2P80_00545 [Beijerinckiaceae bacterium]|nr:hypothetical protein [Beijerinckiaceae bacterium]
MVKTDTECRQLVPLSHNSDRPARAGFARSAISPAFVAQLIAIRMDAEAYRMRRRADPAAAARAYDAAQSLAGAAGASFGRLSA